MANVMALEDIEAWLVAELEDIKNRERTVIAEYAAGLTQARARVIHDLTEVRLYRNMDEERRKRWGE